MQINEDLIQFCKGNDFPICEMSEKDFQTVEKSLFYTRHRLSVSMKTAGIELGKVLEDILKKLSKLKIRRFR